jgi:hypothetical protein
MTAISFAQESNETEKLFKTNVSTLVTKKDSINLDEYKSLILIPGGNQFRKYFEKINYFDKFETFDEFEKEIKKSEFKKEIGDFYGKDGLINAYTKFKKFLCLFISEEKDGSVKMSLFKPDSKELFIVVGQSKTNIIGINAGTKYVTEDTYESMLNELVNYIKANSKTY